jgi:hypothetical protein
MGIRRAMWPVDPQATGARTSASVGGMQGVPQDPNTPLDAGRAGGGVVLPTGRRLTQFSSGAG